MGHHRVMLDKPLGSKTPAVISWDIAMAGKQQAVQGRHGWCRKSVNTHRSRHHGDHRRPATQLLSPRVWEKKSRCLSDHPDSKMIIGLAQRAAHINPPPSAAKRCPRSANPSNPTNNTVSCKPGSQQTSNPTNNPRKPTNNPATQQITPGSQQT